MILSTWSASLPPSGPRIPGFVSDYAAGERAIRHVFVGGQQVVRDGKALAFDYADASARLEMAQRRAIEKVPRFDWAGRSAAEIMPATFPSR